MTMEKKPAKDRPTDETEKAVTTESPGSGDTRRPSNKITTESPGSGDTR